MICSRGLFAGEDVAVDRDAAAAVIAFFAPITEECRRTGHSTAERKKGIGRSNRMERKFHR